MTRYATIDELYVYCDKCEWQEKHNGYLKVASSAYDAHNDKEHTMKVDKEFHHKLLEFHSTVDDIFQGTNVDITAIKQALNTFKKK